MAEENILPDWYPADIHKRELSLEEWAEELEARTFIFSLLNTRLVPIKKNCSIGFIESSFVDFLFKGYRGEIFSQSIADPLTPMKPTGKVGKDYTYSFSTSDFDTGLLQTIVINLDYDNARLKSEFKKWLLNVKSVLKTGEFQRLFFKDLYDGEVMSNQFKPGLHSQGCTAYPKKILKFGLPLAGLPSPRMNVSMALIAGSFAVVASSL